jgi:phosphoribosylanthranilate isomerase
MNQRTRIKFCGMTRVEDAVAACALGVDAIGLVLTPRSRRCITPVLAREIRRALPPFVDAVALFMDDAPGFIADAVAMVQPDLLQFHGRETLEECVRFEVPYIKAIAMAGGDPRLQMHEHPAALAFVFDAHAPGAAGGSGEVFDWSRVPGDSGKPVMLAGGLHADNVVGGIRAVRPWAVDVASGIESAPGIKDRGRMQAFVAAVREADAEPRA